MPDRMAATMGRVNCRAAMRESGAEAFEIDGHRDFGEPLEEAS